MYKEQQMAVLHNGSEIIPNIYDLEKIGAGHDGKVYRYGKKALKLLKYDIDIRKVKKLMTFNKAIFFRDQLSLKRIEKPIDIILNEDGIYIGYVMNYLEGENDISIFGLDSLQRVVEDLTEDFNELTSHNIVAKDINRGSYIIAKDFIHLCDTDKYSLTTSHTIDRQNNRMLNFVIAKYLYFQMIQYTDDKETRKKLIAWVKKSTSDSSFLSSIYKELQDNPKETVVEYAREKAKILTI